MCWQVVVARAEALAKAQFAHRRDPHDCALMYLALKKKQLLTVSSFCTCVHITAVVTRSTRYATLVYTVINPCTFAVFHEDLCH